MKATDHRKIEGLIKAHTLLQKRVLELENIVRVAYENGVDDGYMSSLIEDGRVKAEGYIHLLKE